MTHALAGRPPPPASTEAFLSLPLAPPRCHEPPGALSLSPSSALPLSYSLHRAQPQPHRRRNHGHRAPLNSPPRLQAPPSSAASPHPGPERWDGLHRRLLHLLPPRSPKAAPVDSPPSPPPRARHLPHPNHRELLHVLPLTPWLAARRSRHFIDGRSTPPPELVVDVAPVTIWSPRRA
mgnify:CR=1 FL=1